MGRQRVEAVVQTLAALGGRGESLAEVAHDARNMVTALGLYCDLLEEPGVLAVPFAHYGSELRLVAAASRRLVEKLVALDIESKEEPMTLGSGISGPRSAVRSGSGFERQSEQEVGKRFGRNPGRLTDRRLSRALDRGQSWEAIFAEPVSNLAVELVANGNLLAALAGPGIAVTVDIEKGARPARLTAEDLTRLLMNLVKNAAEAMLAPLGGRIQISLRERSDENGAGEWLTLAIEDNGRGISPPALERIFDSGFTTHARNATAGGGWPAAHRGLGLAISRAIVESAGGHITASNCAEGGARIEIGLPVRQTTGMEEPTAQG
jgi:signal transduction histidine kinase